MLDQINYTLIVYLGVATSSVCATGQLFTAMQPVRQLGCSVCSAFFQCQGAFNAIRRCRNSVLDAATVSAIIAPSADWQTGHRTDLKIHCPPVPPWCVEVVFNPVQYFKVRKDQTKGTKGWTGFRFWIGYNCDRRTRLGLTETKWELSLPSS